MKSFDFINNQGGFQQYRKQRTVRIQRNSLRAPDGRLVLRPNPLDFTYSVTRTPIISGFNKNTQQYVVLGTIGAYNDAVANGQFLVPSIDEDLVLDATNKFYSKVYETSVNMAVFYAERKEAISMVTSNLKRLAFAARDIKRGNFASACNRLRAKYRPPSKAARNGTFPKRWLEYRYGWVPLLGDTYNIINKLFPNPRFTVVGQANGNQQWARDFPGSSANYYAWPQVISSIRRNKVKVKGYIETLNIEVQAAHTLGITNPMSLAWEVLPYSFVIDWFLPVGDYLDKLAMLGNIRIIDPSVTITSEVTTQSAVLGYKPRVGPVTGPSAVWDQLARLKVRRTSIPSLPLPRLKNPLSLTHFADAMSLLYNVFDRKPAR